MMTTLTSSLCFTAVLAALTILGAASNGKNDFKKLGEHLKMECKTKDDNYDYFEISARLPSKHTLVTYDKKTNTFIITEEYKERVNVSGTLNKLDLMMRYLQLNDSGLYVGMYSKYDVSKQAEVTAEGCSILLVMTNCDKTLHSEKSTGKGPSDLSEPLVLVFVLTACTLAVMCLLVIWVIAQKMKVRCLKQEQHASMEYNPVYEDMHRARNK